MPKFDGAPYTQLSTPARLDVQGVVKDISEALPENQTKFARLQDLQKFGAWAATVRVVTAGGTVTLANTDPIFIEIFPNSADRDVSLPAKGDDNHGYYILHAGIANVLTVKRSDGASIGTIAAGSSTYVMPSTLNDFRMLGPSGVALVKATALTAGYIPFGIAGNLVGEDAGLFWDNTSKRLGIGTPSPVISDGTGLHLNGKIIRIGTSKTPASAGATGNAGEICWSANYIYVCVGTNQWKRAEIISW